MLREELEKKECSKEEIDKRVQKAREILNKKLERGDFSLQAKDSHIMAQKKER
jgi:hypothetical protein